MNLSISTQANDDWTPSVPHTHHQIVALRHLRDFCRKNGLGFWVSCVVYEDGHIDCGAGHARLSIAQNGALV